MSSSSEAALQAWWHPMSWSGQANLRDLVTGMNGLTAERLLDHGQIERQILQRDAEVPNPYSKDAQVMGISNSRR
jgi:predicted oxidoreductase